MIACESLGAGPPLILVHGSPGNGAMWKGVVAALGDDFATHAVTLPGHDRAPDAAYTPIRADDLARDVEAMAATLGSPADLVAHSFGGVVALRLALRGKATIRRLVLLEPVVIPVLAALGDGAAADAMRAVFDTYRDRHFRGDARAAETMVDFWFGPGAFDRMPESMRHYVQSRTALNLRDIDATFRETYDPASLAAVATPTLVAYGTRSPKPAQRIATALASALGDGRAAALDGANHAMLTTHPAAVAGLIVDFLAG